MAKYQFLYLNFLDNNRCGEDEDNYYNLCLEDLKQLDNVKIFYYPLEKKTQFIKNIYALHVSKRVNKIIKVPLKKIWYPFIVDEKTINQNYVSCFIFTGYKFEVNYVNYLKKKYHNCKTVFVVRDKVGAYLEKSPDIMKAAISGNLFDAVFSIDKKESDKYGFYYFEEINSKINIQDKRQELASDVFFAGVAKDRLSKLLDIYYALDSQGVRCNYFLVGVPKAEQIDLEGITYSNSFLTYPEFIQREINSKCILEINQDGFEGYTSRFLEAVTYNKRLITNNMSIKKNKFYSSDNICCYQRISDIKSSFINNSAEVDYNYDGSFSPIHLISQIEEVISK